MSVDNRTDINDCEDDAIDFSTTGAALGTNSAAGNLIEGVASVQALHSNVYDDTYTVDDSTGTLLAIDMTDVTVYMLIKDDGVSTASVAGISIVLGDGTDRIGYTTGGSDATGVPLQKQFYCIKLDTSDAAANPGTADVDHHLYAGTEANLDFTAITVVGYGTLHSAKAQGNVANLWLDAMCYIANGSYALTINGGTVGTPETMADVVADDEGGTLTGLGYGGLVSNPLGSLYYFSGPTEWGNVAAVADSYFTASNEQWYWVGDNLGGRAIGANNFPFRVVNNATNTGSWVLSGIAIVNTGTRAQFDMSDTDLDICTMDGCTLIGMDTIALPSSAITTSFTTNTIFSDCGLITSNGADMSGSSVLVPSISANTSGLIWNLNQDPSGVLDNMIFTKTSGLAHHAIEFGTAIPDLASYTLIGCDFGTDFSLTEGGSVGDETFHFLDTTGSITLNLSGCTGNFGYRTEGVTVSIVVDPVTYLINVKDNAGVNLQNARVYLAASDGLSDLPFGDAITSITRATTTATVTHTAAHGLNSGEYINLNGITDKTEDNHGAHQIVVTNATVYTYQTTDSGSVSYTGTITGTGVILNDLTDVSGNISSSRTLGSNQNVNGYVRKSAASPRFKSYDLTGNVVDFENGLTLNVRMVLDE